VCVYNNDYREREEGVKIIELYRKRKDRPLSTVYQPTEFKKQQIRLSVSLEIRLARGQLGVLEYQVHLLERKE
jgi:hypothetical protein